MNLLVTARTNKPSIDIDYLVVRLKGGKEGSLCCYQSNKEWKDGAYKSLWEDVELDEQDPPALAPEDMVDLEIIDLWTYDEATDDEINRTGDDIEILRLEFSDKESTVCIEM